MGRRSRVIGGYTLRNSLLVPSLVRSVQSGTIAIAAAATSNTATITAVDPAHSLLIHLGHSSDGGASGNLTNVQSYLTFTNSTTITATRNTGTDNIVVAFAVVTYWSGIYRALYRGTIVVTGTSATATITAVQTAKSLLMSLGELTSSQSANEAYCRLDLTNSTTVTATKGVGSGSATIAYQVAEFW